ncbi:MAG: 5'-methylthioadenosine/adenosylhomocysteine nucleosidase, partial [Prevotella sp.]
VAMDKEFVCIKSLLSDANSTTHNGRTYITGTIGANEIVMIQCGIGKVNAAMGTTELIDKYRPDVVISTGVAGGASTQLNVQEVVVCTETCYHDVYCGSDVAYGQIPGAPERFAADKNMIDKALSLDCATKIVPGLIVTGDWFVDSREKMRSIIEHFPEAMAVDMESAAIAHVCHKKDVAFISFRIISDIPLKDNKASQYFDFWQRMAENSFSVTRSLLEAI